ncbi:MAG: histidine kinase [Gallionella sp.]|jgi:two-component system sensor histidine kinase AlgZ
MNKARSIKQNYRLDALPDFRNLGVTLRILLLGNGMALIGALFQANGWSAMALQFMQIESLLTPVMLASLLLLWAGCAWLKKLAYWRGVLSVNIAVGLISTGIYVFGGELYRPDFGTDRGFELIRCLLTSLILCNLLLAYFRLRAQWLSRALDDGRLQVLRARIRPHFLYNTINAVLGILRTQPRRAETALEDMADLFRMAMSDEQDLVPLGNEIQLCRQYIALEQLRMEGRLRVEWIIKDLPDDTLIPAFLLQPLLENAVYHGIEPLIDGGCIHIMLQRSGASLQIRVDNPCPESNEVRSHEGNKIALQNIRERLALLFDAEASYQVLSSNNTYRVEINLPYLKEML